MRVALVDLDDTLVDYRTEEDRGRDAVRARCLPHVPVEAWNAAYGRAKREQRAAERIPDAASHTRRLGRALHLLLVAGIDCPADQSFAERCAVVYWAERDAAIRRLDGAPTLLSVLRRHCDRVLLCTAGATEHQLRRVRLAGLATWLDAVITSEQAGLGKEDWPAFLGARWCPDDDHLAVSDQLAPDLDAARRCGMRTAWIRAAGSRRPRTGAAADYTAATPGELAAALDAAFTGAAP